MKNLNFIIVIFFLTTLPYKTITKNQTSEVKSSSSHSSNTRTFPEEKSAPIKAYKTPNSKNKNILIAQEKNNNIDSQHQKDNQTQASIDLSSFGKLDDKSKLEYQDNQGKKDLLVTDKYPIIKNTIDKSNITLTSKEKDIITNSIKNNIPLLSPLSTQLQIKQFVQDGIDFIKNLKNPPYFQQYKKYSLTNDGSYTITTIDLNGRNNDYTIFYDEKGKLYNTYESKIPSFQNNATAQQRPQKAPEKVITKESDIETIQRIEKILTETTAQNEAEKITVLKKGKYQELIQLLFTYRTDPTTSQKAIIWKALTSKIADDTGITQLRKTLNQKDAQDLDATTEKYCNESWQSLNENSQQATLTTIKKIISNLSNTFKRLATHFGFKKNVINNSPGITNQNNEARI